MDNGRWSEAERRKVVVFVRYGIKKKKKKEKSGSLEFVLKEFTKYWEEN